MMTTQDLETMVARAQSVRTSVAVRPGQLSSREAARVLSGVMSWIARTSGIETMHRVAGELAADDKAWSSGLFALPVASDGAPSSDALLVAAVCRGLLELAGVNNVRDALAFWASERSPENWLLA